MLSLIFRELWKRMIVRRLKVNGGDTHQGPLRH
jgi:hypothetical protein